jgi:hypothetical protein
MEIMIVGLFECGTGATLWGEPDGMEKKDDIESVLVLYKARVQAAASCIVR